MSQTVKWPEGNGRPSYIKHPHSMVSTKCKSPDSHHGLWGVFDIRGWDYIRYSSNIGLYLYPPAIKHGNPDIPERNWHLSVKIIKLNGGFSSKPCYEVAEGCGGQYSLQERLTSIIQTRMLVAICLCCCTYLDVWPIGGREFTYSSRLGTVANPLYHPVGYVQRNV